MQKLREQTKGENWYNIPATPITDEIKNDLQVLQMRSVLNKNQFYKKNDIKEISKYFHVCKPLIMLSQPTHTMKQNFLPLKM